MQVNSLVLLVIAVITLALFALAGFVIHRLADSNTKRIVATVVALTALLGVVPAIVVAFQAFAP